MSDRAPPADALWDEWGTPRQAHVTCPQCHEADEVGSHLDAAWCCNCGWCGSLTAMHRDACRRCSECKGQEHHWLTAVPVSPEEGEPYIPCKHCSARAAVCEGCFEAPVFPRMSDQPLCADCRLEGA